MLSDINDTIKDLEAAVGTPEFEDKVKEARDLFVEAFEKVKEVVKEREEILGAKVLGYESGIAYAKVEGSFKLSGNFSHVLIKGEGNVTLPEENIVTKVERDGELHIVARGQLTASGDGEFRIIAIGKGTLDLSGEGYYRVKPSPKEPMGNETEFSGDESLQFGVIE